MKFSGKVWKFGDNIDTDAIIPARYLNTTDHAVLASHCMEDIDLEFVKKVKPGDIIVATSFLRVFLPCPDRVFAVSGMHLMQPPGYRTRCRQ